MSNPNSTTAVGNRFTFRVLNLLLATNADVQITPAGVGDRGVDIYGSYCGFYMVVQCKDQVAPIRENQIREFEGVLSRYNFEGVFGLFIISSRGSFTKYAQDRARSSPNLVLTTDENLEENLEQFQAGPSGLVIRETLGELRDLHINLERQILEEFDNFRSENRSYTIKKINSAREVAKRIRAANITRANSSIHL
ncbi:17439_t:CDS:2 [Acaulospora morrowiae]|uniref:17439_t:CDS:1 n=1 Tax=Acaulospora morrowiae TaxID=94023 RepID=A0A9N9BRR3_9GLOM|nr:17439_t:CDS:2 [Acaulospora morrowiae]